MLSGMSQAGYTKFRVSGLYDCTTHQYITVHVALVCAIKERMHEELFRCKPLRRVKAEAGLHQARDVRDVRVG